MTGGVIKSEICFMPEYVPLLNPCREAELEQLQKAYLPMLQNVSLSPVCILSGPVGSGKTMLAKKVGSYLEDMGRMYGIPLKNVYINCRFDRTPQLVLGRIAKSLSLNFPLRGYEVQEILEGIHNSLVSTRSKLFLVLDEITSLLAEGDENLLYSLLRMGEIWGNSPASMLIVSKDMSFLWNVDESVKSSLQKVSISLASYNDEQLYRIVLSRAEEGLEDNALDDEAARLIASLAGDYGDARYAIELLYRSALAALQNSSERIGISEVRMARKNLPPHLSSEELRYLTDHEKFILIAVAELLSKGSRAFVSTGEVETEYRNLCSENNLQPYAHTMLWECIQKMKGKGFLLTTQSGKGYRGRTTLIGLVFHPNEVLERAESLL
ncbi:MAG: AAA family ATPase [Conexivisphaerales archaeon]